MNEHVTLREAVESAYAGLAGKRQGEKYTLVTKGESDGKVSAMLLSSEGLYYVEKSNLVMWHIVDARAYDTSPPAVEGVPLAPGAIVLHPYLVTFATDVTKHANALAADIDRSMQGTGTHTHTLIIQSMSGRPLLIVSPAQSTAVSGWAGVIGLVLLMALCVSLIYRRMQSKKVSRRVAGHH